MSKGIVILAFGKPAYIKLAFNLALSIKYFSSIPIHLVYQYGMLEHLSPDHLRFFDTKQEIDPIDLYDADGRNPGKMKTRLYKYMPFDENIYLDADAAAVKDITGLFDQCEKRGGFFYTQIAGYFSKNAIPENAMPWAHLPDVWKYYKLKEDAILPATNSSFLYVKKGKQAEKLFERWQKNFTLFPMDKLRMKWGGGFPDELALNATLAQQKEGGNTRGIDPLYFSRERLRSVSETEQKYYLIAIYGAVNFTHKSVTDYYDRLIHLYSSEMLQRNQEFKSFQMIKDKHANRR